ncbi:MAG: hypothetical protein IT384_14835 [Deltaproteobacteria bacterium]|nr:hypothetical protein [Deltaproteobacteria bacterium]
MPLPGEMLAGLRQIAAEGFLLAVVWHLAILSVLAFSLFQPWRPSHRFAHVLLAMPLGSVSALAFAYGNPFNGAVFALLTAAMLVLAVRSPPAPVEAGPRWALVIGAMMIALGLFYPHFLESRGALAYLFGAPVGLLPCPTLSLVIGFVLVGGGLESRTLSALLGVSGLFYGIVGALRLGVWLDLGLLLGAAVLLILTWAPHPRGREAAA